MHEKDISFSCTLSCQNFIFLWNAFPVGLVYIYSLFCTLYRSCSLTRFAPYASLKFAGNNVQFFLVLNWLKPCRYSSYVCKEQKKKNWLIPIITQPGYRGLRFALYKETVYILIVYISRLLVIVTLQWVIQMVSLLCSTWKQNHRYWSYLKIWKVLMPCCPLKSSSLILTWLLVCIN